MVRLSGTVRRTSAIPGALWLPAASHDDLRILLPTTKRTGASRFGDGTNFYVVFIATVIVGCRIACGLRVTTGDIGQIIVVAEWRGIAKISEETAVSGGHTPGNLRTLGNTNKLIRVAQGLSIESQIDSLTGIDGQSDVTGTA